jgi:ammonia channel protein AmtB
MGFHDFAGTTTIHLVGGTAAFWGAMILGERYGKDKQRQQKKRGEEDPVRRSINFNSHEMEKLMRHVNRDYH